MQKLAKGAHTKVRKFLQYLVLPAGLIVVYVILLMAGQAIPRSLVMDNVQKSYLQLEELGLYYEGIPGASWDNWTDSYFMNSAVTQYDGTLLQKAIANAYTTYSELDESGSTDTIDDVRYALEQDSSAVVKPYSRYWVGMLTIYKILLLFMPINGIRILMFVIAAVLFLVSAVGVYKMLGAKGLIPYVVSVIIAQYFPQALCLVFNTDIAVMFLVMAVCWRLFCKNASTECFGILFFLCGSILAYLNYWAFPLITLGFPLVFVLSVRLVKGYSLKYLTKEAFILSLSWGVGLAGTVLAKQILCKFVLGTQSGTGQLFLRMGSEFTLNGRLISVVNGLVRRMTSTSVLILTVTTAVGLIVLLKIHAYSTQYKCCLLLLVALYPIIWWFMLPNHCIHGFVIHMYGVTYYAMLSTVLINVQRPGALKDILRKKTRNRRSLVVNTAVILIWAVMSYGLFHVNIHYGAEQREPWSLETIGTINTNSGSHVMQEVQFTDFTMLTAYLKSVSTILVNLPDDKKDGTLHVEILEHGNLIGTSDVPISSIEAGEWFEIPLGCTVALNQVYQITYAVQDNRQSEPYLLVQDAAQAVGVNKALYADGGLIDGALANKYDFDAFILPVEAKVCIAFIVIAVMEYGIFLFESGKDRNKTFEVADI
ncbi:MAG: hypothetical protein K2N73_17365 [Lachnospiraceae bacterium]|nr:hypothetical protein [Lachnospiraceae bacterium]